MSKRWVVGMTGASGAIYGVKLVRYLLQADYTVHLVVTDAGWRVLHDELGWNAAKRKETLNGQFSEGYANLVYHPIQDIGASIASGSFRTEGMVVLPCSMGTLSGIAHGASGNLLERAADVMLKENRKLLLVPRETPLSVIHLENMLRLARLGVAIIPAMPAFYQQPSSLEELTDFMVGRVLDSMKIEHDLYRRWGEA
ncbi:UbiX family flavin prenyltransferase [Gorillibacterium timonense]|uniref:UbiX family flavin prenyltransferase n=1 Tax=Gorillibacterium timonense TaxID=1689269 RepID=UPI00071D45C1|nr:flavin prenyltransferase UbiX [Gorillibacterium timonense]